MQNRCCTVGCNLNNSSKAYTHWLATLKILRNFILRRTFTVYMKTHCSLKFHFGQFDRGEISTEGSFTLPEVMWTLIMKLPHTEVKLYPEMKSQIDLSSLRILCKRA